MSLLRRILLALGIENFLRRVGRASVPPELHAAREVEVEYRVTPTQGAQLFIAVDESSRLSYDLEVDSGGPVDVVVLARENLPDLVAGESELELLSIREGSATAVMGATRELTLPSGEYSLLVQLSADASSDSDDSAHAAITLHIGLTEGVPVIRNHTNDPGYPSEFTSRFPTGVYSHPPSRDEPATREELISETIPP